MIRYQLNPRELLLGWLFHFTFIVQLVTTRLVSMSLMTSTYFVLLREWF